jgi:hypothetical protein
MIGKDSLFLDESMPGKMKLIFPPAMMRGIKKIIGFSGTIDNA